jgi:O-succinylbenzoic acid--CoA ligase
MVVDGWLARAAAARPQQTALQTPSGSMSYAELLAAAQVGADELAGTGVRPGQRVAIALPAGLGFAQALHACLLLGAVAVPLDPRASPGERALITRDAALLIEEPLATPPPRAGDATGGARAVRGTGTIGGTGTTGGHGRPSRHDLDATAVVIHTSGTTSAPRPIELSYGNFLWSALGSAVALGLDPGERWLCALPVAHVSGLSILVRSCIYATTAVIHERFEADHALHAIREQGITLVSLVATTLGGLLDAGLRDPPSLRSALTGGGPVPDALVRRASAAGVPVSLTYGLTEACSQVTTGGPPLFCTRVRIAADQEILVKGPTVAANELGADGWLHTGDLGGFAADGRLEVSGRKADTIISGGEKIAPAAVEAVLEAHPHVLEAAVLGRADPRWGEAVTALVVTRPDAVIDVETLRAHCAGQLARYKVPKHLELVPGPLPRTRSGKLLRRGLG